MTHIVKRIENANWEQYIKIKLETAQSLELWNLAPETSSYVVWSCVPKGSSQ